MNIPTLLAEMKAKLDAFTVPPAQTAELTAQISTLTATVATLTGERDGFKAQVDTLTSTVSAITGERDTAKAASDTATAEATKLRAEAKTAEARALEIVAVLGVAPAAGGNGQGSQGKAKTTIDANVTGAERVAAALKARQN